MVEPQGTRQNLLGDRAQALFKLIEARRNLGSRCQGCSCSLLFVGPQKRYLSSLVFRNGSLAVSAVIYSELSARSIPLRRNPKGHAPTGEQNYFIAIIAYVL